MSTAKPLDEWADKYGDLKAGGPSQVGAWLGIPLIVASLIGMLWAVPVPVVLTEVSPAINFATLFVMATFVYYCILSVSMGLSGFLFLLATTLPSAWLSATALPLGRLAAAIFVCTFALQLIDTRKATGRLLVTRNLQYLMLGPVWLIRAAFRRFGMAY